MDLNSRVSPRVVTINKGHNSVKTEDGVMVFNLCMSPDDGLYLYQVSRIYLKGFKDIERMQFVYPKFSKWHNSVNSIGGVMVPDQFT